jgi:hypothetical protein
MAYFGILFLMQIELNFPERHCIYKKESGEVVSEHINVEVGNLIAY